MSKSGEIVTRMFQISEDDLRKMESGLPRIMVIAGEALNNAGVQALFGEMKDIISNVRWDYGPPQEVRIVRERGEDDDD